MNIELQYLELLKDILENGVKKSDRTQTGTISVFGRQIRHKMSEGFPVITTKKMAWKQIITELLWFLRGDTNIKYLLDNDCHIWDGDAFKNFMTKSEGDPDLIWNKEQFILKVKNEKDFGKKWGELGSVYGKQWRDWKHMGPKSQQEMLDENTNWPWKTKGIDQIANLINDLKTNPDSRRLMVNAWNVGEIDQMVLPPCHYGFQVYTRELSLGERVDIFNSKMIKEGIRTQIATVGVDESYWRKSLEETKHNIPTRAISLMWSQRSIDSLLGLPFNIASYATLLEILAKEVNMVADELIGNLGDCHIYSNHIEQVKEQISRTPYKLPTLKFEVTNLLENLMDWKPSDFSILNYESHPAIKAPLSN
jgi:thymidylate synthase